jgi:hypothetical protein
MSAELSKNCATWLANFKRSISFFSVKALDPPTPDQSRHNTISEAGDTENNVIDGKDIDKAGQKGGKKKEMGRGNRATRLADNAGRVRSRRK